MPGSGPGMTVEVPFEPVRLSATRDRRLVGARALLAGALHRGDHVADAPARRGAVGEARLRGLADHALGVAHQPIDPVAREGAVVGTTPAALARAETSSGAGAIMRA
jgi:hypothetical protein